METNLMHLKILLPFKIFADIPNVTRLAVETTSGSFGLWPQRLDCTAAMVPGILLYETTGQEAKYIAVGEGVMVKAGSDVYVSVRNAIGDAPLGKLKEMVETELKQADEKETEMRSVMAKLESNLIRNIQQLKNG